MPAQDRRPVILLVFANDRVDGAHHLRNLAEESRLVWALLDSAETRRLCEPLIWQNATRRDIFRFFEDSRYRGRIAVFHFGGHAGGSELMVETDVGAPTPLRAGPLADFLGSQKSLRLVFLNGCSTDPQVERLLGAGVPAVIATTAAVSDARATELAVRFYAQLAGGERIDLAHFRASSVAQSLADDDQTRELLRTAPPEGRFSSWGLHVEPGQDPAKEWSLRIGLALASAEGAELYRRYCDAYIAAHSQVEVPASHRPSEETPKLESVFVDPALVPARLSSPPGTLGADTGAQKSVGLEGLLAASPLLVILGDMGAGKSTLLRQIALGFAREDPPPWLDEEEHRLPIFVDLAEYASDLQTKRTDSLLSYINTQLRELLAVEAEVAREFLSATMESGSLCLCLDGLDKVGDSTERKRVVGEIAALTQASLKDAARNRILVTSRWAGYAEASLPDQEFRLYQLLPPSPEATAELLSRWWGDDGGIVAELARDCRLDVGSFLLATIAAITYRRDGLLPGENDAASLGRFVDLLLDQWDEDPGIQPRERELEFYRRRGAILAELGYALQAEQKGAAPGVWIGTRDLERHAARILGQMGTLAREERERQARRLVELLRFRSGLLVGRRAGHAGGTDESSFWHPSLQEYLAARHVATLYQEEPETGWALLADHVADPRWEGVLALTLGCLHEDREPVRPFLERIVDGDRPYESVLHQSLFLANRLVERTAWLPENAAEPVVSRLVALADGNGPAGSAALQYLPALARRYPAAGAGVVRHFAKVDLSEARTLVETATYLPTEHALALSDALKAVVMAPPGAQVSVYNQAAAVTLLQQLGQGEQVRDLLREEASGDSLDPAGRAEMLITLDAESDALAVVRRAVAGPSGQSTFELADLLKRLGHPDEGREVLRRVDGTSWRGLEAAAELEREGLVTEASRIRHEALKVSTRAWGLATELVEREPEAYAEVVDALVTIAVDPLLDGSTLRATVRSLVTLAAGRGDTAQLLRLAREPRILRWAGGSVMDAFAQCGQVDALVAALSEALESPDLPADDLRALTSIRTIAVLAQAQVGSGATDVIAVLVATATAPDMPSWEKDRAAELLGTPDRRDEAVKRVTALARNHASEPARRAEALLHLIQWEADGDLEQLADGIEWGPVSLPQALTVIERLTSSSRSEAARRMVSRVGNVLPTVKDPVPHVEQWIELLQQAGEADRAASLRERTIQWARANTQEEARRPKPRRLQALRMTTGDVTLDLLYDLGDRSAWAAELERRAGHPALSADVRVSAASELAGRGEGEERRRGLDFLAALADDAGLEPHWRSVAWNALDHRVAADGD